MPTSESPARGRCEISLAGRDIQAVSNTSDRRPIHLCADCRIRDAQLDRHYGPWPREEE